MSEGFMQDVQGQSWTRDVLSRLKKLKERIHSSKTRTAFKRIWLFPEKNSTVGTTYEISEIIDMRLYRALVIQLINLDTTNDLLYKVEACLSPNAKWEEIVAETTITANASGDASGKQSLTDAWAFIRVQIKSSAGTVGAKVIGGLRA